MSDQDDFFAGFNKQSLRVQRIGPASEFVTPQLVAAVEQRGRDEILREVAKLPSPWRITGIFATWSVARCSWCNTAVEQSGQAGLYDIPTVAHPDNPCLWPRALAVAAPETPKE